MSEKSFEEFSPKEKEALGTIASFLGVGLGIALQLAYADWEKKPFYKKAYWKIIWKVKHSV